MRLDHVELRNVLLARLDQRKQKNPRFSMRSYAKNLGMGAAELSEFLRDRRALSDKRAGLIIQRLDLDPDEEERIIRRGTGILAGVARPTRIQLSVDDYESISDWFHFAILSLAETVDFKADPAWIASRLNISEDQASCALERLLEFDMLLELSSGQVVPSGRSYATTDEIPSRVLRAAHRKNFALAADALDDVSLDKRDFRSVTMAIDPVHLPEAKKLMAEFRDRLSSFLESGDKKEVYKFCMQLFPLTTVQKSEGKASE